MNKLKELILKPVSRETTNCLSIDVEGFVEANLESFYIDKKYVSRAEENVEIEQNINFLLDDLEGSGIRATFFFLGRIGRDIPSIVRRASQYGHEIACHGYEHLRIHKLSENRFRDDLVRAKSILEDVSGQQVFGFRAPDFSITEKSLWALDVLSKIGFIYDSSIYPVGFHDVYGIREANPFIYKLQNGLLEFPLSSFEVFGKRLPFGGGGYFRIYPLALTKHLMKRLNTEKGIPCMFYIHPYEVGPIIPYVAGISYYRRFRHYFNCRRGRERLKDVLSSFRFGPIIEVLRERGFVTPSSDESERID